MIKTEKDDCFKQLKPINNILKDESFLYPYKETIENFFYNLLILKSTYF